MGTYQKVLSKGDVPSGSGKCVQVKGRPIAVFNSGDTFYAIDDLCTHADASLAEGGLMDDCTAVCPWHGAQFDIRTGEAKCGPACDPVRTYAVRVKGDAVEIEID